MKSDKIVCGVSNWFWVRALAVFALFAAMTFWFLYDYKFGYPKKNYKYTIYKTFVEAKSDFIGFEKRGNAAELWANYAQGRSLAYPEDLSILPSKNRGETWPEELQDFDEYQAKYEENKNSADPPMWKEYTARKKWGENRPDHLYERSQINEQLGWATGASTIGLSVIVFCMLMKGRKFTADEDCLILPSGKKVKFTEIYKIDKRKWESKGLATLYYKEGSANKSLRIDGMVYGQFKEEDGQPAEQLFQRVLTHFKGELIELIEQEEASASDEKISSEG